MARGGNSGDLGELEAALGMRFAKIELLEQALTHGSMRHEQQTAASAEATAVLIADNERMEFLGDAIVGLAVAEQLYQRYPELDEGALTRLRAALVSRKHLGHVGAELGLGAFLRLGKAEERSGGRRKSVLLANCMEAILAAIYLEGGLAAAGSVVERLVVGPYVDALRDELRVHRAIGDYKSALQELLQGRHAGTLEYALLSESGPDHRKRFVVEARVHLAHTTEVRAQAEASTKKKAEQEAARMVYERITERTPQPAAAVPATSNLPAAAAPEPPSSDASSQQTPPPVREDVRPAPASRRARPALALAGERRS